MQRFLERHAHAFLWVISGGLLLVVLAVTAREGGLGEPAQTWIRGIEAAVEAFFGANAQSIDYASKVIGALVTVFTAVYGIVKGIHYSEKRLPERLAEFIKRSVQPVEGHAATLVAAVADPTVNARPGDPLFYLGPLNRALKAIGGEQTTQNFPRSHDEIIYDLNSSIVLAETRLDKLKALRAHVLLARGAAGTATASTNRDPDGQADRASAHAAAERDFEQAALNKSTSTHAYELRGLLRCRLGNFSGALSDFEQMINAASAADWLTKARGQRYAAETLRKLSNDVKASMLREARRRLKGAWTSFNAGKTPSLEERKELARNRLAYADLAKLLGGSQSYAERILDDGRQMLMDGHRVVDKQLEREIETKRAEAKRAN